MSATDKKINYKKTLNLPKTDFPMKANLAQNEPQTLKKWKKDNLYQRIIESNKKKKTFVFHDGPPYANGSIHVGHLLNKVLKDFVVRSQNIFGKKCEFIPGWDCHGLPIEHKVMTEIFAKDKESLAGLSRDDAHLKIRYACAKYASKFIKLQSQQMQTLLTMADYDNPYLTMVPRFEKRVLEVFSDLVKEGIVYRQLKPVHWSIANKTALAEAELEYQDRIDISIYVNFQSVDSQAVYKAFNCSGDKETFITIWTTTPWTLPANLAVSVHPRFTYALVEMDGVVTIVAEDLIEQVQKAVKAETVTVLGKTTGENIVGLAYQHPFCDREGKIVAADYVTLEDGSGLVHTAPGHGVDDYQTGLREGLDVYCPVLEDGTYDDTVPDWIKGQSIWDANTVIVERLRESGNLVDAHEFNHSYPHDWRSKTPVIFRSTEQWFISVDNALASADKSLRDLALNAIKNDINFVPGWGQNRLRGMLEARPDWCISRQRSWGLPIPAFRMADGQVFMTEASVKAVATLFGEKGSDAWFKMTPADLLIHYNPAEDTQKPENLDLNTLEKMYDIFDVWFESGSSWNAVLNERNQGYPADLYLEGSDQHRGWFHLSLLPALGVTKQSPFKAVLTHGFIVDKDGHKMSKSTGNALNVEDLLKKYGAEVARLWVSSLSFENDIKVDLSFFDIAGESYRKIRNTVRFLLSNINDCDISVATQVKRDDVIKNIDPKSINAYVLQELTTLQNDVKQAYFNYKFKTVNSLLYNFCNDTLSSFYCTAVKDRLYCDSLSSERRQETQYTLWTIIDVLCRLLAPVLPHTAQEAFASLYGPEHVSIHLADEFDVSVSAAEEWTHVLASRERVLKVLEEAKKDGIENSLDAGIILGDPDNVLGAFKNDLSDIFSVSRVSLTSTANQCDVQNLQDQPRCERSWKRDETVKQRQDGVYLSDRDFNAVNIT